MENNLVPLNISLNSDLEKAQHKTVWCRIAAMDTVTPSSMEFANDNDDDIYDSEHRLKLSGLKYILV